MDDIIATPSRSPLLLMIATDGAVALEHHHSRWIALLPALLPALSAEQPTEHLPAIGDRHGSGSGKPKSTPLGRHTAHGLSPARQQLPTRPVEGDGFSCCLAASVVGPLAGATRRPLRGSATKWATTPVLSARETLLPHTSQCCVPHDPGPIT